MSMCKPQIIPFNGSYENIEEIAETILSMCKKEINENISTRDFLTEVVGLLGGKIITTNDPSFSEYNGGSLTIENDQSFTIQLSPYTSAYRDNFTIAHELGHLFIHHAPNKDRVDYPVTFSRFGNNEMEWQANRFAASFLMPKDEFIKKCREYKNCISLVASYFEVSETSAKIRYDYLIK